MIHTCNRIILSIFGLLLVFIFGGGSVRAQTKIAFLAGVERYEKDGFDALNYAENDALALKAMLGEIGFECETIVGKDATLHNLKDGLDRFYQRSKGLKKEDVVLVFFSGHGVQRLVRQTESGKSIEKEEPFFCPVDAHKHDTTTLLSINEVLARIQDNSGSSNNIMLIDACRESLDKGKTAGFDGSTIHALSNKMVVFFAAQSGQRSWESHDLQHGLFTFFLLQGLRGEAKDQDDEVTLASLTNYVSKRVERESQNLLGSAISYAQRPNAIQNSRGSLVLRQLDNKAISSGSETAKMSSSLRVDSNTKQLPTNSKRYWEGEVPEPIAQKLLDRPVWRTAEAQAEVFQTDNGEWYVMAVGKWKLANRSPREACDVVAHGKLLEVLKGLEAQVTKKLTDDGFQKFVETSSRGSVPQLPPLAEWESEDKAYISVLHGMKIEK